MQSIPTIVLVFGLFAYALTRMPGKYKPTWTYRFDTWQKLIGLVAIIAAILIVISPEIYALGVLGDSAFFDLLVLAISIQLQTILARMWSYANAGFSKTKRFVKWRMYVVSSVLMFVLADVVFVIQKVIHRVLS